MPYGFPLINFKRKKPTIGQSGLGIFQLSTVLATSEWTRKCQCRQILR